MASTQQKHSVEQLQQWAAAIEKEIEQIRGAIAPLEQRLDAARERLDLMQRLIRLTEGAQPTPRRATGSRTLASSGNTTPAQAEKQDLEAHLEYVLSAAGKPMHISKIRQALVDRAIPLPGRGDE